MNGSSDDEMRDEALDPLAPESDEQDAGLPLLSLLDADAGPARALSERQLLVLTDRVERQFAQRVRSARRWAPRRLWLAGGLFAASAAAAVYGVGTLRRGPAEPLPSPAAPVRSTPEEVVPALPAAAPSLAAPSSAAPSAAAPPVTPPVAPPPQGAPDAKELVQPEERPTELPVVAPKLGNPSSGRATVSRAVVADRLASANSLRAKHRYREALALYLQVIEIAPNRMQASVARVAAAEMQLEQFGDVAGAERLYREARTQGGELTAEAQFGLAQVARARTDVPEERRALQGFLQSHPESPLAAAARRRLTALGGQ